MSCNFQHVKPQSILLHDHRADVLASYIRYSYFSSCFFLLPTLSAWYIVCVVPFDLFFFSFLHQFLVRFFLLLVLLSRQFNIAYIDWLGGFVRKIQYFIESIMFKLNLFSHENLNKYGNYIIICDIFTG